MKSLMLLAILMGSVSAHATALPTSLFGEWRENCIKALDLNTNEVTAPFVQLRMVLGGDGTLEHNYVYYSDNKCTKRQFQKREYVKYKVLSSTGRKAKLLIRKDLGDGVISQSVIEVSLAKTDGLEVKTLSSQIEIDDLLPENPLEGLDKNAGSGESVKKLSRYNPESKSGARKL